MKKTRRVRVQPGAAERSFRRDFKINGVAVFGCVNGENGRFIRRRFRRKDSAGADAFEGQRIELQRRRAGMTDADFERGVLQESGRNAGGDDFPH